MKNHPISHPFPAFCRIYSADTAPLASSALFDAWYSRMPVARRARIDRSRDPEIRRLSLAAGALLDLALRSAGLEPASETFGEGPHGKPFLRNFPDLYFNLSHSGTKALCVLSSFPCGCDVERIGRGSPALARRFFMPEEFAALEEARHSGGEAAFSLLFARIWTRKESCLKATGDGLYRPMNSFSVLDPDPSVRFFETDMLSASADQPSGYASCVCLLARAEKNRSDSETVWPVPEWISVSLER